MRHIEMLTRPRIRPAEEVELSDKLAFMAEMLTAVNQLVAAKEDDGFTPAE